ncbi:MAG: phenylalanine--tRNA ligase subunit beta [Epsilonproteobacteria bacterium]|nr:MAG: phenylalanine--tRNA ligase subunit beta [Campylobacterota bacterium]
MIVTRNWLQEFIDISHFSTDAICEALNSIGLEVDSVDKTEIPDGVVVGLVESCKKHPDADKLNICQVDVGSSKVQIVCGAKNVAKGQYVPVAMVGANLGNDFIIKEAVLRGVDSHGMICSTTEIGLPKLNDGILELDDSVGELILGKSLNTYEALSFETIEIELTANRGDCLSINGIARELSTYFNISFFKNEINIKSNNIGIGQVLEIKCENNVESNLIYKATNITKLKFPLLYKLRTAILDIIKSTDIETAMAYSTHATGVLLNVYTKAIASASNNPNKVSLKINKDENNFDTVVGEVVLSTVGVEAGHIAKEDDIIILEASYTAPEILAQRVFDTKQKTGDIYYKASRGSEPDLESGLEYFTNLLSTFGGTIFNGDMQYGDESKEEILAVRISKINSIIGQDIPKDKIVTILTSLGFKVKNSGTDSIALTIPNFRHDCKNIADITEEIVRIVGIDNIQAKPLEIEELNRINNVSNKLILNNNLRAKAISNGFYETVTYVFSQRDLLSKYKFEVVDNKLDILNPITKELNTFRTTLALNLVQAVSHNEKQGFKSISFFESGIVFDKNRDESKCLGFICSGEKELESVSNSGKVQSIDFFGFSQKVTNCIGEFDLEAMTDISNDFIHPYQNANIIKDGECVGTIYKLHPSVASDFDISNETFIALIDFDKLSNDLVIAQHISKYQSSKRDLSIIAPKSLEYKEIRNTINNLNIQEIKQFNLVDIYTDEKLGDDESLTIKFVLQSETKTLEESDIVTVMDKVLESLKEELSIGIR